MVSDSVSKKIGIEKSIGFGIEKKLALKKVSDSVSKKFGIEKVSDSVLEKSGIGKKFRIRFRLDFGFRHTLGSMRGPRTFHF